MLRVQFEFLFIELQWAIKMEVKLIHTSCVFLYIVFAVGSYINILTFCFWSIDARTVKR